MIMVGAMLAVMWGIGLAMGAPRSARWAMTLVLLAAVIIVHLVLPDGHPLREATGSDIRLWLLIVGFGLVIWGYRRLLRALKRRVVPLAPAVPQSGFTDTELNRYARHIMLREVGGTGQAALKNARVLVIGAGGLGSPALMYLAASGVGTLGLIDDDHVDASNLQRQIIHRDADIGDPKVQSAADAIRALNPFVTVQTYQRRLTDDIAADLFAEYDLILDGCDNFATRYLVNRTAVALEKPLIAGALTQWEGQISLYDPASGTPCYACIFPDAPDPALVPSCAEAGVIGPLPGVIGSMMAVEAVKEITGAGEGLRGRLLIYDALYAETRVLAAKPNADCTVCNGAGLVVRPASAIA